MQATVTGPPQNRPVFLLAVTDWHARLHLGKQRRFFVLAALLFLWRGRGGWPGEGGWRWGERAVRGTCVASEAGHTPEEDGHAFVADGARNEVANKADCVHLGVRRRGRHGGARKAWLGWLHRHSKNPTLLEERIGEKW